MGSCCSCSASPWPDAEATTTRAATRPRRPKRATTSGGSSGGGTTLNGSVGPGFDISLDGTDGITAGDYTLVVNDQSTAHNFHLTGPGGVDVSTEVSEEGEKTFDVTLVRGRVQVPVRSARELR